MVFVARSLASYRYSVRLPSPSMLATLRPASSYRRWLLTPVGS
jgi:hypothetical protein